MCTSLCIYTHFLQFTLLVYKIIYFFISYFIVSVIPDHTNLFSQYRDITKLFLWRLSTFTNVCLSNAQAQQEVVVLLALSKIARLISGYISLYHVNFLSPGDKCMRPLLFLQVGSGSWYHRAGFTLIVSSSLEPTPSRARSFASTASVSFPVLCVKQTFPEKYNVCDIFQAYILYI